MAWKTPFFTFSGSYSSCTFAKKWSYNSLASSPPAAPWKSGLFPFLVDASKVNWDTIYVQPGSPAAVYLDEVTFNVPQSTSPLISCTFFFHFINHNQHTHTLEAWSCTHTVLPFSSGHIFSFTTLAAIDSTSLRVSSLATAAKTSTPFPIDETKFESTVTEAEATRCRTADQFSQWHKI